MKMRVPFSKVVYGFIEVEGKDKKECWENFNNGDWLDEFDNKSDYDFDEERVEFEEDSKPSSV